MLSKKNRLTSSSEIKNVLVNGKSTRSGFLFFKFTPNKFDHTRFAFSVGIKYSKNAVKRNTLKRKLRSVISENLTMIEPGYDCVFFVKGSNSDQDLSVKAHALKCLVESKLSKTN